MGQCFLHTWCSLHQHLLLNGPLFSSVSGLYQYILRLVEIFVHLYLFEPCNIHLVNIPQSPRKNVKIVLLIKTNQTMVKPLNEAAHFLIEVNGHVLIISFVLSSTWMTLSLFTPKRRGINLFLPITFSWNENMTVKIKYLSWEKWNT